MTFNIRNVLGVSQGKSVDAVIFTGYKNWPGWLRTLSDYAVWCHLGHALDFAVALLFYLTVWPRILPRAHTFALDWVGEIVAFNLVACWVTYGSWHLMTYSKSAVGDTKEATGKLAPFKFNKTNQYHDASEGHLSREIFFTNLGWVMAALFTSFMAHVYATGKWGVTTYEPFFSPSGDWTYNAWSVGSVLFVSYWRELHFYWVHRFEHAWFPNTPRSSWWRTFDLGDYLYRIAHSLHHKSVNPGPWSGMSMHPIELFLYFTCTILPLLSAVFPALPPIHALHHIFAVYHACVAPIGGHDGYAVPGGGGDYHYLHHAALDCNYGVPLVDFDRYFGSWVELEHWQACGKNLRYAKAYAKALEGAAGGDKKKALEMVAKKFDTTADNIKKGN